MKKLKFIVPVLLLMTIILVGGACNDKDKDDDEKQAPGQVQGPGQEPQPPQPPQPPGPQPTDFLTYENVKWDFTISYPKDWEKEIVDEGTDYITVGFLAPHEDRNDIFKENVIVLAGNPATSGYSTFDDFIQAGIAEITDWGGQIISSSKTVVAGRLAQKVVYTIIDYGVEYQLVDYYVDGGDVWFVIMYTSEKKSYAEYIDEVEAMISSLEIR